MQTYHDKLGTLHQVEINLLARRRISKTLGVDLLACAADPKVLDGVLTKITEDDDYLFDLLACIEDRPKDELLSVADGTSLENAATAFVNALIDFFPQSSPMREPLRTVVQKSMAFRAVVLESIQNEMTKQVNTIDFTTADSPSNPPKNGSGESAAA